MADWEAEIIAIKDCKDNSGEIYTLSTENFIADSCLFRFHHKVYLMADKEVSKCPFRSTCAFYNKLEDLSSYKTLKILYCLKGHQRCEIFKRWTVGKAIPDNMLSNGTIDN